MMIVSCVILSCVSLLVIMSSKGLILSTGCSYGRTHPSIPTYLSTITTYLTVYHIYLPELSHAPSYMFYHHIIAYHEWTTRTGELLAAAAADDDATVIHLLWLYNMNYY